MTTLNMSPYTDEQLCAIGKQTILIEARALTNLSAHINENFAQACRLILQCQGHIVVTGIGKSGHIGKKIVATLASTGTPAFFLHPAEASHGDFGMVRANDVIIGISNSGETRELIVILPLIRALNVPLILLTGNLDSTLAKQAHICLAIIVDQEACPHNLAPTASTTAALAMGDALAISLLRAREFTSADFARVHPQGSLGTKLILTVNDIMHKDKELPQVEENSMMDTALVELATKRLGVVIVTNPIGELRGLFQDKDLDQLLSQKVDLHSYPIKKAMRPACLTITAEMTVMHAYKQMKSNDTTILVVLDNHTRVIGIISINDILKANDYAISPKNITSG